MAFSEINISGHAAHESLVNSAELVPDGDSVKRLISIARELGIYIVAGIVEKDEKSCIIRSSWWDRKAMWESSARSICQ